MCIRYLTFHVSPPRLKCVAVDEIFNHHYHYTERQKAGTKENGLRWNTGPPTAGLCRDLILRPPPASRGISLLNYPSVSEGPSRTRRSEAFQFPSPPHHRVACRNGSWRSCSAGRRGHRVGHRRCLWSCLHLR